MAVIAKDSRASSPASAGGTPTSRAMTVAVSGSAMSPTTSAGPPSGRPSSSSLTQLVIQGEARAQQVPQRGVVGRVALRDQRRRGGPVAVPLEHEVALVAQGRRFQQGLA